MIEINPAPQMATIERQSLARASISFVVPRLPSIVRRAGSAITPFQKSEKAALQTRPQLPSRTSSSDARPPSPPPSYSETVTALFTPKFARRFPGLSTEVASTDVETAVDPDCQDPDTIHWKYANQGISLLTLSAAESTPAGSSTPFARQLYVHALTYLLRALPSSLTDEEQSSLTAALPVSLAPTTVYASQCDSIDEFPEYAEDGSAYAPPPQRTLLHRIAAQVTIQAFVLLSVIIPWIQYLLSHAFRINKQHHLTERFFSTTLNSATLLSSTITSLFTTIWSLQDGRLARLLESLASWLITSLSAGVYDGVGEGMAVIGLRQADDRAAPQHQTYVSAGPPPASPRASSRARAGSLRVPPPATGLRRELRKARSHDAMRPAYVGVATSGVQYGSSPAKARGARRSGGPVARCQGW